MQEKENASLALGAVCTHSATVSAPCVPVTPTPVYTNPLDDTRVSLIVMAWHAQYGTDSTRLALDVLSNKPYRDAQLVRQYALRTLSPHQNPNENAMALYNACALRLGVAQ